MDYSGFSGNSASIDEEGLNSERVGTMAGMTIGIPTVAAAASAINNGNNNEEDESESESFLADVLRQRSENARNEIISEELGLTEELINEQQRQHHARASANANHQHNQMHNSGLNMERDLKNKAAGGAANNVAVGIPGAHHVLGAVGAQLVAQDSWKGDVVETGTIPAPRFASVSLENSTGHSRLSSTMHSRRSSMDSIPGAFRMTPGGVPDESDSDDGDEFARIDEEEDEEAPYDEAVPTKGDGGGGDRPSNCRPNSSHRTRAHTRRTHHHSHTTATNSSSNDFDDNTTSHDTLAVASLVNENEDDYLDHSSSHVSANLPNADEIDLQQWRRRQRAQRKQTRRCVYSSLVVGLLLIVTVVVVVLVVMLSKDANKNKDNVSATVAPSSLSPWEAHVLSLLPEHTVETISGSHNINHATPQSWAFDWIMEDPNLRRYKDDQIVQRFAMATFYYSTTGHFNDWFNNTLWLSYEHHECEWLQKPQDPVVDRLFGYDFQMDDYLKDSACDENRTLKHIWHYGNGLEGSLPPELSLLQNLHSLDLAYNQLTGSIPSQLGQMTQLEVLWLHANSGLTGRLPTEIGLMSSLVDFSAVATSISGTLPSELGFLSSSLEVLMHDNSQLTGSIPTQVGLLSGLRMLYLNHNQLTGSIPTDLGGLTAMFDIGLEVNVLTGTLPSELAKLSNVGFFFLEENQLVSFGFLEWMCCFRSHCPNLLCCLVVA